MKIISLRLFNNGSRMNRRLDDDRDKFTATTSLFFFFYTNFSYWYLVILHLFYDIKQFEIFFSWKMLVKIFYYSSSPLFRFCSEINLTIFRVPAATPFRLEFKIGYNMSVIMCFGFKFIGVSKVNKTHIS